MIDELFDGRIKTLFSTSEALESKLVAADVVVGAVLIPGAKAPKLVTRSMLGLMQPGSVLVDVAIDQGGCFETSRATSHRAPVYQLDGINHYCVANIPGAVARTSTFALTNATLPYIIELANKGAKRALLDNHGFLQGLNVHEGQVTCEAVAVALDYAYVEAEAALQSAKGA